MPTLTDAEYDEYLLQSIIIAAARTRRKRYAKRRIFLQRNLLRQQPNHHTTTSNGRSFVRYGQQLTHPHQIPQVDFQYQNEDHGRVGR